MNLIIKSECISENTLINSNVFLYSTITKQKTQALGMKGTDKKLKRNFKTMRKTEIQIGNNFEKIGQKNMCRGCGVVLSVGVKPDQVLMNESDLGLTRRSF